MRHTSLKWMNRISLALTRLTSSRARRWASIVAVLIGTVLVVVAVRAYNHSTLNRVNFISPSTALPSRQAIAPQGAKVQSKLSFQPVADKLRHQLGERFTKPGRERQTLLGTLTVGAQQLPAVIVRTQNDDGEQVGIALGPGPASLTWSSADGAKSGASLADGVERQLIERLALDSADQFVLAQFRSSYRTIATGVVPKGAGVLGDYSGPAWDVVLVSEPDSPARGKPMSSSRLYYINTATGLLDKVVSREHGQAVSAEFSGWVNQGGEKVPTHIGWRRNDQLVMEFNLSGASYGPRQ